MEEYKNVNKSCFNVRDRLGEVFQKSLGKKSKICPTKKKRHSALHELTKKMSLKKAKETYMKNEFTTNLLKKKQTSLFE